MKFKNSCQSVEAAQKIKEQQVLIEMSFNALNDERQTTRLLCKTFYTTQNSYIRLSFDFIELRPSTKNLFSFVELQNISPWLTPPNKKHAVHGFSLISILLMMTGTESKTPFYCDKHRIWRNYTDPFKWHQSQGNWIDASDSSSQSEYQDLAKTENETLL